MIKKRNLIILLVIVGVSASTIPLILYNISVQNPNPWEVRIFGSGVNGTITISYDDLISGEYLQVENRVFDILNRLNYTYSYTYTGVSVWDVLQKSGILYPNATKFRFSSEDNYICDWLPLNISSSNPEKVILAYIEDGKFLETKIMGGYGPMRSVVDITLVQQFNPPTYNSQFWVKYTNGIEVS